MTSKISFPKSWLQRHIAEQKAVFASSPADFWHKALYCSFWVNIAFFPIGYGFREVMPLLCLVFLLFYYKHAWSQSVLARLKPVWLFICPLIMTLIGIIFSIHPWESLLHAGTGVNKAFILPFIGMECAREGRDIKNLVWAFAFACFWQGLDGIWQSIAGHDFIMGYPPRHGRLTGSLGDYTVGNYIALALVPACGVWFIIRQKFNAWLTAFIFVSILWPAMFLLIGASSRSGILALAGSCLLWIIFNLKKISCKLLLWPTLIFALFIFFQPARFTAKAIMKDNRWDLWGLALQVFEAHPWLGAGAGQYNSAFRALNLAPQREVITISHPHNVYLDLLYAHGLIGFGLGMTFLAGFFLWCSKKIIPHLRQTGLQPEVRLYWQLTCWMFLGYAAWLINGIFGHDFYRIWWLAMAMTSLGISLGAITNAPQK